MDEPVKAPDFGMIPTVRALRLLFAEALRGLIEATSEMSWSDEQKQFPRDILLGKQISGRSRMIQDCFARVCQDLRIMGDDYFKATEWFFSSWLDWKQN